MTNRKAKATPTDPAPADLSADTWAAAALGRIDASDLHRRELVNQGAECLRQASKARAILARDGLVQADRFKQTRPHPAAKLAADALNGFLAVCRELALEPVKASKPNPFDRFRR